MSKNITGFTITLFFCYCVSSHGGNLKGERKNKVFDLRTNPTHCALSSFWASSVLEMERWSDAFVHWSSIRKMCCKDLWVAFFQDCPSWYHDRSDRCLGRKTYRQLLGFVFVTFPAVFIFGTRNL